MYPYSFCKITRKEGCLHVTFTIQLTTVSQTVLQTQLMHRNSLHSTHNQTQTETGNKNKINQKHQPQLIMINWFAAGVGVDSHQATEVFYLRQGENQKI